MVTKISPGLPCLFKHLEKYERKTWLLDSINLHATSPIPHLVGAAPAIYFWTESTDTLNGLDSSKFPIRMSKERERKKEKFGQLFPKMEQQTQ
jgi:hypothetical protein